MTGEKVEVNVRIATKHDVIAILNVGQEWIVFNPEALVQRLKTLEETFTDQGHMIFIAEIDKEIVGWIEVRTYEDWFMLRRSVHIEHAVVLRKYRDKEVGSQILKMIFDYFKNLAGNMYVVFWCTESSWNGFWEKHNKMQNSGQKFFIKLVEKKKRT